MSENFAPYKRESDHTFIHSFTQKINKVKRDLEELHELTEAYIQNNLQKRKDK